MQLESLLAYTVVAGISIISPGPAVLLALRNSATHGVGSVLWSSLGNVLGLFVLSGATMLGLGTLLRSSSLVFEVAKLVGAVYLFYIGIRHLVGRNSVMGQETDRHSSSGPSAARLFSEGFLVAATNPKPILFFAALFPQFLDTSSPLIPQFFVLTGIFMSLSFASLLAYASVAGRAKVLLLRPRIGRLINRSVGIVFISFGAMLLSLRKEVAGLSAP